MIKSGGFREFHLHHIPANIGLVIPPLFRLGKQVARPDPAKLVSA